jgi:hypothetical protein
MDDDALMLRPLKTAELFTHERDGEGDAGGGRDKWRDGVGRLVYACGDGERGWTHCPRMYK